MASEIILSNTKINIVQIKDQDYICITDMLKVKDGDFFITDWLRNRNTLEFLGIWESIYNSLFNYGEFATIEYVDREFVQQVTARFHKERMP